MRITEEIADSLLHETRKLAAREGVTLRTLIERGVSRVLAEARPAIPFKLRRASFKGKGLNPEFRGASWESIRHAAYTKRGG